MPLKKRVIIRGDGSAISSSNISDNSNVNTIDIPQLDLQADIDIKQIWVNPGDAQWAYYYTKKEIDALLKNKEDLIQFIYLENETGYIDEDVWQYITTHLETKLVYDNHVFELYTNSGNPWIYQSINQDHLTIDLILINPFIRQYRFTRREIAGNAKIEMRTTAEWNSNPGFISQPGVLYCYTDYSQYEKDGQTIIVPGIKVGSGAYLIDEPFINQDVHDILYQHTHDLSIHVSPQDRERWDNKLNYEEPTDDLLIFTIE